MDMNFNILTPAAPVLAPRAGTLAITGRKTISTPHYIPSTSRGTVPHIAQDVVRKETAINGLYVGLEDFIEKKHPAALYKMPITAEESPLRKFICASNDMPLILGPRRFPAITCPPDNTNTSIAIFTSLGFQQLTAHDYIEAIQNLKPDIVVGFADLTQGKQPGLKRRGKMVDRTHAYTRHALEILYDQSKTTKSAYFAPILPLDNAQQTIYLDDLEEEFRYFISGLALFESDSFDFIPESLGDLPRLLFSEPPEPHDLLRQISLGADLLTIPFVNSSSDAGLAFDFTFPAPVQQDGSQPHSLAIDLWSPEHKVDVSPLRIGCECFACRKHHRAYLNHLLAAKEMTSWALLQLHNHYMMDLFFEGVRGSIQRGSFEEDVILFNRFYEATFPEPTGEGPRLRGYQLPAAGPNQPRRAPRVYGRLNDVQQMLAESRSSVATPDTDCEGLEHHGFAAKV